MRTAVCWLQMGSSSLSRAKSTLARWRVKTYCTVDVTSLGRPFAHLTFSHCLLPVRRGAAVRASFEEVIRAHAFRLRLSSVRGCPY